MIDDKNVVGHLAEGLCRTFLGLDRFGDLFRLFANLGARHRRAEPLRRQRRRSRDQLLRVRMLRALQNLQCRTGFDDTTLAHHDQMLGALGGQAQIVSDEKNGGAEFRSQTVEVVEDLTLDGDVERRRRLVRDQEFRTSGQPDRDQCALTHTARELVRVLAQPTLGFGEAGLLEQFGGPNLGCLALGNSVGGQSFLDLEAHFPHGIQIRHRVLRNQTDLAAPDVDEVLLRKFRDVLAVEDDLACRHLAGAGKQIDDRVGGGGLTGARFAHDGDRLPRIHGQADASNCRNRTGIGLERHLEITNLEQRSFLRGESFLGGHRAHRFRDLGSRASRRASPIMMNPRTVIAKAVAG